jgi:hypothetical protein
MILKEFKMKGNNKNMVLNKLFNEAQMIAKSMAYDPWQEQGHFNNYMDAYDYCNMLATEIFVRNEEYDPRIKVVDNSITPEIVEWYYRFSDYEAIANHPDGEAGARFDNVLTSLCSIGSELSDINKRHISLNRDQVNRMNPDDVTVLIGKGEELMDKMAAFMKLIDRLLEELIAYGEQEVTYN